MYTSSGRPKPSIIESSDDKDEEVGISLTPGEINNIILQNSIPDAEGLFECNPDEVEINAADARERRFRIRTGITAVSGAGDPAFFQTYDQREEDSTVAWVTSRLALRICHRSQDSECGGS